MDAQKFASMCRFEGGKPGLYFRDHLAGRIKVLTAKNEWIATLIPGELLLVDAECVLLSMDNSHEFRVSYGEAAALISALQQGGWDAVGEVYELMWHANDAIDLNGL